MEAILFYILAGAAVISALLVITRVNPVFSALMLIVCFLATAGIFAMLEAVFLAVLQVLIYAGAIMVLFLFVVMFVHTDPKDLKGPVVTFREIFAVTAAGYLAVVCYIVVGRSVFVEIPKSGAFFDSTLSLGRALLTQYIFPFEILSVLLLIAIVGAVVLAKKKI